MAVGEEGICRQVWDERLDRIRYQNVSARVCTSLEHVSEAYRYARTAVRVARYVWVRCIDGRRRRSGEARNGPGAKLDRRDGGLGSPLKGSQSRAKFGGEAERTHHRAMMARAACNEYRAHRHARYAPFCHALVLGSDECLVASLSGVRRVRQEGSTG